jgi:hypothetical protein
MSLKPSPRKVNDRVLSPELRAKIDGKLDKISAEAIHSNIVCRITENYTKSGG